MKDRLRAVLNFKAHWKKIVGFFFVMDGGKEVVRLGRLGCFGAIVILGGAGVTLFFGGQKDTSVLKRTDRSLSESEDQKAPRPQAGGRPASGAVGKMLQHSESKGQVERPRENQGRGVKVNYKAQQVLVSDGAFDPARTMPMGTNLIGKTLTTIDTRQAEQLVKVLLPHGGRASSGGELPKNSVLFGQVTYGGKGEKVFVKFNKGVFPSGQEFQVEAQGLSPSDYSPGLSGRFHGNADMRVASSLGLTMVAGMSDVLTEKESIGGGGLMPGSVTAKSNMRNALYNGVGKVAQSEATRQAEAIGEAEEYVTVDAGTDLIISLSKAYVEK